MSKATMEVNKEDSLVLDITDIHPEDGLSQFKDKLIGVPFDAFLTTTSTGHPGWYLIAGVFTEETGVAFIDQATKDEPVIISMAKYEL